MEGGGVVWPPAPPSDWGVYGGDFERVWDCGERESGTDGRGGVGDQKEQTVNGREGYTVLELPLVLDWPSRLKANANRAPVTRTPRAVPFKLSRHPSSSRLTERPSFGVIKSVGLV